MWIVKDNGDAINTEVFPRLEAYRFSVSLRCVGLFNGNHPTDVYSCVDYEEAEAFLSWLLQQMEDGKRVVRVSDFRREPVSCGVGNTRYHDHLTGTIFTEPSADSEGGEA